MSVVDQRLVVALTRSVQAALERDATTRMQADKPALGRAGQEALADSVLRSELQRIDEQRLADGTPVMSRMVSEHPLDDTATARVVIEHAYRNVKVRRGGPVQ